MFAKEFDRKEGYCRPPEARTTKDFSTILFVQGAPLFKMIASLAVTFPAPSWADRENPPLAFRKSDVAMGATIRGRSCGSGTGWVHLSWNRIQIFARAETTSRAVIKLVFGFDLCCLLLSHCHASMLTSFSTFLFDFFGGGGLEILSHCV